MGAVEVNKKILRRDGWRRMMFTNWIPIVAMSGCPVCGWRHPERSCFSSGARDLARSLSFDPREIPRPACESAGLRNDEQH
jgi:hypothetical protein